MCHVKAMDCCLYSPKCRLVLLWGQELGERCERVAEEARKECEVEVSTQRAQDQALQAYLDQMSLLLIERGQRIERPSAEITNLARARTLAVLPRLDGMRRGRVVRYLYESGLISNDSTIVDLSRALLREVHLSGANLSDVKLSETNLSEANLSGAMLNDADLSRANLSDVDLSWSSLIGANLSNAYLAGASFIGASLSDAYLGEANLRGGYMSGVYMEGAKGVTNEELEQHAHSKVPPCPTARSTKTGS